MTSDDRFGGTVSVWLQERAGSGAPDYLDDILGRTARTRQRPGWTSIERWPPVEIGLTRVVRPSRLQPRSLGIFVITGLLVGAVLAALVFTASQRRVPPPFGPARNGVILSTGGDSDIFVSNPDGSGTRPLISGPTRDMGPWFRRDGTQFMFWRELSPLQLQLWMANADGGNQRPIIDAPLTDPYWQEFSPTDDRIAIVHEVDGVRTLSIVDVASGSLRTLAVPGLNVDNNVFWLPPNGDELIFSARPVANSPMDAGLYAIKPDGSGFREILPASTDALAFQDLDLAQDGSRLAYWVTEVAKTPEQIRAHVHLVDLATGVDRQVVFDRANDHEAGLRFSPDGTTGAIVGVQGDRAQVELVDLAGSAPPRRVGPTFASDAIKGFAFSPDGMQVIALLDGEAPMFVDVASGQVTTGPTTWEPPLSWQRLAH